VSVNLLLALTGLGLGGLYFLVASGLSLIFGLMRVLNFAHGAFLTLGVVGRLAHRAVVLNQGRVVHDGDAAVLLEDEALTRRLLGVSAETGAHQ
jgi:branched-subunit amino acid ABC-type transport system permease component